MDIQENWRSNWSVYCDHCLAVHCDGWVFEFDLYDVRQDAVGAEPIGYLVDKPENVNRLEIEQKKKEVKKIYNEYLNSRH